MLHSRSSLVLALTALFSAATTAQSSWTATSLHPLGWIHSEVEGVHADARVGSVTSIGGPRAVLWHGEQSSFIDLTPGISGNATAYRAAQGQQVGYVAAPQAPHASLWTGSAPSWVDLHPIGATASTAHDTDGTHQVGVVYLAAPHAALWRSTPGSWRDLHPANATQSIALGIDGQRQVGSASFAGASHAILWFGSAESYVDLHPVGASFSRAVAIDGVVQAGFVMHGSGASRAARWTGSAASFVDLDPPGSGHSEATDVCGDAIVGFATFDGQPEAAVWNVAAATCENLRLALPDGWSKTHATSVWKRGAQTYIGGYGFTQGGAIRHALVWTKTTGP